MAGSGVFDSWLGKTARRLPGIRFVTQTPAPDEMLPRMDVAVFVGFAERCDTSDRRQTSSPEHVFNLPVAVDSIEQYTRVFGPDLPLAWDPERREVVYAYLGPAVRAFFRNGGRRCWVIRVPLPTHFRAGVFLDPDLWNVPLDRLQAEADTIRYQQERPRALRGIHAALEIEEATIIAVPDAVHRPWVPMELAVVEPPDPSEPLPRPEWWHALPCDPPADPPAVTEPERGLFLARDLRIIAQPSLSATVPDSQGSFELTWDAAGTEDTIYRPGRGNPARLERCSADLPGPGEAPGAAGTQRGRLLLSCASNSRQHQQRLVGGPGRARDAAGALAAGTGRRLSGTSFGACAPVAAPPVCGAWRSAGRAGAAAALPGPQHAALPKAAAPQPTGADQQLWSDLSSVALRTGNVRSTRSQMTRSPPGAT